MDPRILKHYERELQYLREMGAEFAADFPKIAGRLGMHGTEVADPFVERLLEGVAFLTARVQLRIDAEFPNFLQHLFDVVYPKFLAPTPSMAIVQFEPDYKDPSLKKGSLLPKNTALYSKIEKDVKLPSCQFRTAHPVTLWPIELTDADYFSRSETQLDLPDEFEMFFGDHRSTVKQKIPAKAGIQLRFHCKSGSFNQLPLDRLPLHLKGNDRRRYQLFEQFMNSTLAIVIRSPRDVTGSTTTTLDNSCVRATSFDHGHEVIPQSNRSFQGYRLLEEYFAMPELFLFVELTGLADAIQKIEGDELEVIFLFNQLEKRLERTVTEQNFGLFCSPAINLFSKRLDRIHLSDETEEYHVIPDRTQPLDFEVFQVTKAMAYGTTTEVQQEFYPFYAENDVAQTDPDQSFFTIRRVPRLLSSRQKSIGFRSSYIGSEVYISLVDGHEGPFRGSFRQLGLIALCTNRDLPLYVPIGKGTTDFTLEVNAPVKSTRILTGPTKPIPSAANHSGELNWQLINLLSLNYLSLVNSDPQKGAASLRELVGLFANVSQSADIKQIDGIESVTCKPIVRRIMSEHIPIAFGRGIEIELKLDELAFDQGETFLFASILEEFFAKYVSLNSFVETVFQTLQRGEVARWPIRIGRRQRI